MQATLTGEPDDIYAHLGYQRAAEDPDERYQRLDSGARAGHPGADLATAVAPEDGASTVLPGDCGIHQVGNPGEYPAISVHLYGPCMKEIDGRDDDSSRNYVCDQREDRADAKDVTEKR